VNHVPQLLQLYGFLHHLNEVMRQAGTLEGLALIAEKLIDYPRTQADADKEAGKLT
jgi:hypothetical protein